MDAVLNPSRRPPARVHTDTWFGDSSGRRPPPSLIRPRWMFALLGSIGLLPLVFWFLGLRFLGARLSLIEYFEFTVLLATVVTGCYQLFFWVQRNNYLLPARSFKTPLDDRIPFQPGWIWVYSFLYYIGIGYTVVSIRSLAHGMHLVFGGVLLLLVHCLIFYFLPSTVPHSFRTYVVDRPATRYLRFVQSYDFGRNCFPSMHCSVAAYVGLILAPELGWWAYGFVAAIAASCVFVKQHQLLDLPPGLALGWGAYEINSWFGSLFL